MTWVSRHSGSSGRWTVWTGLFVVFASMPACTEPLGDGFGSLDAQAQCLECHSENGPLLPSSPDAGPSDVSVETGHAAHRNLGMGCEICHIVPVEIGESTHIDPAPAEVVFSGKALSGGARPVWNAMTRRCEGTYCHGGVSEGGTSSAPSFADGPGATATCESCHGNPPNTGAHARHMKKGVLCIECHRVPVFASDFGHVDGAPADVTFGGRALLYGLVPWYDGAACHNTYCHGATLGSGTDIDPTWVPLAAGNSACDTCHGNPPLGTHYSDDTDCASCHPSTVNGDGTVNWQAGFHIDGVIE